MGEYVFVIALVLFVLISGCVTEPVCGDGKCESGENCPEDCGSPYTYTYGAKFEPPEGRILHGMGQFNGGNADIMELLGPDKKPASSLAFFGLISCDRPWEAQRAPILDFLSKESAAGRIPHISIDFSSCEENPTDPYFALDEEVAQTTKHDWKIEDFGKIVADYKKPVFVRISGEFEGWWAGHEPYVYPLAFAKVVNIIREQGADNAAFIWCFSGATNDFDEQNSKGEWKWFPGDDVIDWYSIDIFESLDFTGPLTENGVSTTHGNIDRFLKMAEEHGKPVIIAESSAMGVDITSSQQDGIDDWNEWFVPYFELMEKYPQIKAFDYINVDWSEIPQFADQGWLQANMKVNTYISEKYVEETSEGKYLHADEIGKLKDYWKYK